MQYVSLFDKHILTLKKIVYSDPFIFVCGYIDDNAKAPMRKNRHFFIKVYFSPTEQNHICYHFIITCLRSNILNKSSSSSIK